MYWGLAYFKYFKRFNPSKFNAKFLYRTWFLVGAGVHHLCSDPRVTLDLGGTRSPSRDQSLPHLSVKRALYIYSASPRRWSPVLGENQCSLRGKLDVTSRLDCQKIWDLWCIFRGLVILATDRDRRVMVKRHDELKNTTKK